MTETLLQLLEAHGYPIVFLAALLESVFVVGLVVPGQVIILAAGLATPFTGLDPLGVAVAAAAGDVAGNLVSLLIGRYGGPAAIDRSRRWLERRGLDIASVRDFVRRRGGLALVIGRPAWGFKNVLPAVVGASGMPLWRAMAFVLVASAAYYPLLVGVAYAMGVGVQQAARVAAWLGAAVALGLAALLTGILLLWRRRARLERP